MKGRMDKSRTVGLLHALADGDTWELLPVSAFMGLRIKQEAWFLKWLLVQNFDIVQIPEILHFRCIDTSHPSTCRGPCKPILNVSITQNKNDGGSLMMDTTGFKEQVVGQKLGCVQIKSLRSELGSIMPCTACCHMPNLWLKQWLENSCRESDVCNSILARGGRTFLDKLIPTNTGLFTSFCLPMYKIPISRSETQACL